MLIRNLFFIFLVFGGVATLVASLIPPRHGLPPTPTNPKVFQESEFLNIVHRVDASFGATWSKSQILPAPPADDLTIARRLALGLMGTIPSLEEIRQLESRLPEGRLTWWIDHILQDRRYADYLGERFSRVFVGTEDGPFILFRRRKFRTWLSDQIAQNIPYDKIVREILCTEGIWTQNPATNFITVTSQNDKANQPDPVRLAGRVTRAFLGIRLDCAQCHDHPFASWKQADFESFSAFFAQTHVGLRGVYDGLGEYTIDDKRKGIQRTVAPGVAFSTDLLPSDGTLRERLSAWVTHPENNFFSKALVNRMWAILCGQPLVAPVDNLETAGPVPPALDLLANDFAIHGYDLARLIRIIASTQTYQRQSISLTDASTQAEKIWAQFPLTRLRPEQVALSVLQATSVATINAESHIITRLARFGEQNDFVKRYGDSGEDEFDNRGGTIPQRLVMMNGKLVSEKTKGSPFSGTTRIQWLAPDNPGAVEAAYLAALTRRPTPQETAFFEELLGSKDQPRGEVIQDLFWTLINSTEFSWNH